MCNNSKTTTDNPMVLSLTRIIVMLESMLTDAHGYNQQLAEQYRESQKQLTDLMSRFNERGNELVDQDGQINRLQGSNKLLIEQLKEAGEQVRLISERLGACTKSRTNLMLLARKRRLVVADALLWLQNLDVNDSSTLAGRGNLMTRCEEAARPVDYETGLPVDATLPEQETEPQPQAGS